MKLQIKALPGLIGAEDSPGSFKALFIALRIHFVPPSFLPAIICSLIPWSRGGPLDVGSFLLVVTAVTVNHFGLNMIDDVFDYRHSVDLLQPGERNPYTGGSGVITAGLITDSQLLGVAMACFAFTALAGFYLFAVKGPPVLILGLFGLFCSVFYTVPPIKFGYRGLGELALIVNFGPVIGLGSYYVQSRSLDLEPFAISLVLGLMMWSMIIINEIPDFESDRRAGKLNLVVRFGRRAGSFFYIAGLTSAYLVLATAIILGVAPYQAALGFLSMHWAVRSVRVMQKNLHDGLAMAPANLDMIKVHFITGAGLVLGYILHGMT